VQDCPPFCDRTTGANCVNPPAGAACYPFLRARNANGTCTWQKGGPFIPGTTNSFGGSAHAEFGPLLATVYPAAGPSTVTLFNNINSGDQANPLPGDAALTLAPILYAHCHIRRPASQRSA
jgi:hypothetical protein